MFNNQVIAGSSGQGGGFYDFPIEQSLRFNDDDSAYLSRTPSSASNRKTWTFSAWIKLGSLSQGERGTIFQSNYGGPTIYQDSGLRFAHAWDPAGTDYIRETVAVFRDPSAWYHVVWWCDTTQVGTRWKIYVNGVEQSLQTPSGNNGEPAQNTDLNINSTNAHTIGNFIGNYFDGYMAEVNFIDGQALDATSFGEFKSGIWTPVDTAGLTFGTNGFRLQFNDTTEASGFNTVTYTGNGSSQSISGVGFSSSPDLVWVKQRDGTEQHQLFDTVRGAPLSLSSSGTFAENNNAQRLQSFDADGFTLGNDIAVNQSAKTYVAWTWDAGTGSAASNTDGSITSTVKANTDYGFSIVSYTGTGSATSWGHGLGVQPDMVIVKNRSGTNNWAVYHSEVPATQALLLSSTNAAFTTGYWNNTAPTSSIVNISGDGIVNTSGNNYIAYCFAEKTNYSKFSSYTGTGATGNSITTGFKPAFVMTKKTSGASNWNIIDNTRNTSNPVDNFLIANGSNTEFSGYDVDFTSTGFILNNSEGGFNASGETYIYMAFADTRDAAFWRDTSGQNNDWQPNNLTFSDVVPDGTNNFCTYNPNSRFGGNGTFSEGNLRFSGNSSGDMSTRTSTVIPVGMKFYFEAIYSEEGGSGGQARLGIDQTGSTREREKTGTGLFSFDFRGSAGVPQADDEGSLTTYGSQPAEGDVVGIAVDLENGKLYAHKANSYYNSGDPAAGTGAVITGIPDLQSVVFMSLDGGTNYNSWHINFGQDSTFAGRKSAGGNADENGYGDFAYAPPSGYLSLCSANLPSGAIDTLADETPEDYFNTVLYTGNSGTGSPSTQSITGVGYEPDLLWIKDRTSVRNHILIDQLRGDSTFLKSNATDAEATNTNVVASLDADGFTVGDTATCNFLNNSYVAWNWKAGGAGVSNTDGSITSTVSVGATSQQNWFSISQYTGTGSSMTWGHGLGVKPDLFIVKKTNSADEWIVYPLGATGNLTQYLKLHTTAGYTSDSVLETANSSVLGFGSSGARNGSGDDYICYSFANAEGLCKVGSYIGNGSADGSFIFTGFRPAFVLVKSSSNTSPWLIMDNTRDTDNQIQYLLRANSNGAETTNAECDFLSNGFKYRGTSTNSDYYHNVNTATYIYLAIAEQPFKYANAR